ncbi:MAG: hypothetical protein MK215_04200, partial [Candidatus Poseidoniia archaeon]|nr:hypothetical protein [Candidatus Poseidoniia archaeon]
MRNIKFVFPIGFLILLSIVILLSGSSEAATERDYEARFTQSSNSYSIISDDGRYMASVDYSGTIYYYAVSNHTLLWSYDTGAEELREIDITANGSYVVTGHSNSDQAATIFLFDREFTNDEPLWSYETSAGQIYDVSISAQGNTIVMSTQSGESRLYVFDVSSSTPLWSVDDCTYTCQTTTDISADGKYFVTRNRYDVIRLHSIES